MPTLPRAGRLLLCCLFLCFSALAVAQGKVHHHKWEISYQFKSPDCVRKLAVTINGQTPGPTIRATQGDTVVVTVTNSLLTENVAIHWHGIRQIGTPWADGTEGVTHCPILPGDTFTYRFVVDRPSTYMYNAHYGMQRSAGLNGMIVVDIPPGQAEPFAYDREHAVLLNDWWHKSTYEQAAGLASMPMVWVGEPQALLINGRARFVNCSTMASCTATNPECSTPVFTVVPGKTYRFRIASVTSLSALNFEIESLSCSVRETFNCSLLASGIRDATRPDCSSVAPFTVAAGKTYRIVTSSGLPFGQSVHLSTASLIALIMAVQVALDDQRRKNGGGRDATVAAMSLLILLAIAALPNAAIAARPSHDGGGHGQAATGPVVAAPGLTSESKAKAGYSACTNDPNTQDPHRCVHH